VESVNHLSRNLRQYGSALFVVIGLVIVGITTNQVQQQQRLPTRAAADKLNSVEDQGIWVEPEQLTVLPDGSARIRIKLSALQKNLTHARLVLNYLPGEVRIVSVENGTAFLAVNTQIGQDRLLISSQGDFFGTATWVEIYLQLLSGVDYTELRSDDQVSSLSYGTDHSRGISGFHLKINR
jgi:hypothetical protein